MSTQFDSVSSMVPNAMGGTDLRTPQSIFHDAMNHYRPRQQNESQWLKMPQVPPMSMPWSIPSLQQPDLVRFTGERPLQTFGPIVHQKRKLETPDVVSIRPTKQFITEEKMAQHFSGLQISPNMHAQHPATSTSTSTAVQSPGQFSNDLEINLPSTIDTDDNNTQPRLIISDELKRLQQEPILPSSLLSKLERPSMALVLWEPPSKHLRILPTPRDTSTPIPSSNDSNNNNGMDATSSRNNNNNNHSTNSHNNNNESIPNLNQAMDVIIADPTLEPMDL